MPLTADPVRELVDRARHLQQQITALKDELAEVEDQLADAMPDKKVVLDGLGEVERFRRVSRVKWDSEALLRAVLDSRLVNPDTGEVADESPLDRVRACYALTGSSVRLEALRERQIDPDEYCATERRGWRVRYPKIAPPAVPHPQPREDGR